MTLFPFQQSVRLCSQNHTSFETASPALRRIRCRAHSDFPTSILVLGITWHHFYSGRAIPWTSSWLSVGSQPVSCIISAARSPTVALLPAISRTLAWHLPGTTSAVRTEWLRGVSLSLCALDDTRSVVLASTQGLANISKCGTFQSDTWGPPSIFNLGNGWSRPWTRGCLLDLTAPSSATLP